MAALRARLDELMPEPLDDVLERQARQRAAGGRAVARDEGPVSRNRSANKVLRALLRDIERAGATVTFSHGGHWKVYLDGVLIATVSGTCSNRRAHFAVLADLRRAGLGVKVTR